MSVLSVTQEDRLLLADLFDLPQNVAQEVFAGTYDDKPNVSRHLQAIASFRLAAEAATREECAVEFPSWFVPCVLTAADNGNALTLSAQDIKALAFRIRQLGGDHDAD